MLRCPQCKTRLIKSVSEIEIIAFGRSVRIKDGKIVNIVCRQCGMQVPFGKSREEDGGSGVIVLTRKGR
jgi:RNase P subunit RPR2